jgi:hypothetical protein
MKKFILAATVVLAIAARIPVWADDTHHPESSTQPTIEMTQDNLQVATMGMKETRMKMETASTPNEQQALMHEHMQQMKQGMMMMDMTDGKGMMRDQDSNPMTMMECKMEMMMEMMRGMMSQQEMMMKK